MKHLGTCTPLNRAHMIAVELILMHLIQNLYEAPWNLYSPHRAHMIAVERVLMHLQSSPDGSTVELNHRARMICT